MHLLVNKGGGAAEGGGGQHIHDAADGAGVADGEHLNDGQLVESKRFNAGFLLFSLAVLATFVTIALVLMKII